MPNLVSIIGMKLIQISIIHENTCTLTHKKCHYGSYLGDIEYHMTLLSTIFNIMT